MKTSEKDVKQDCERIIFVRLAEKIKKRFPRLLPCIVADKLHVSEKVLQICEDNKSLRKLFTFIVTYVNILWV